jgi:hypothetical protein
MTGRGPAPRERVRHGADRAHEGVRRRRHGKHGGGAVRLDFLRLPSRLSVAGERGGVAAASAVDRQPDDDWRDVYARFALLSLSEGCPARLFFRRAHAGHALRVRSHGEVTPGKLRDEFRYGETIAFALRCDGDMD